MCFNPTQVNLSLMKINTIGKASTLVLNQTTQVRKRVSNKKNQGFGEHSADCCTFIHPISVLDDADVKDSE